MSERTFTTEQVSAFLREQIAEATDPEERARHEHVLAYFTYEAILLRRGMSRADAKLAAQGRFPLLYEDDALRDDWQSLLSPERTTYAYL